jgi:aminopeptidase N
VPKEAVAGVSEELAEMRSSNISNVRYNLLFEIPKERANNVEGILSLTFDVKKRAPIVLDFKQGDSSVISVTVNGKPGKYVFENEHIVLSSRQILKGENQVNIKFYAGDQSLNRREDLLYTLLVPDRARTLFPCFDQPDIKSRYSLSLEIPAGWEAVANGQTVQRDTIKQNDSQYIVFSETEPIPTYLFSFVVGKMNKITKVQDGRKVSIYHRESAKDKIAQCDEIFSQIFSALRWMEDYTNVKYPFTKYDIVIIPGFQYGGMEHMGATLYSDKTMFLSDNPTIAEKLARAELVAHETAHMWFGDYVTMKWFDEVWTKEVFANWFAKRMVAPLFPEVNHELNFLNSYFPAAYAEDRTSGATPVRQELDNLNNAGLVYGNIIYDKAPIVMDKLVRMVGEDNFKKGIREYLENYSYGNATWNDLINILDKFFDKDLKQWSHVWINEAGMPRITATISGDSIVWKTDDPRGRGLFWEQPLSYKVENSHLLPNVDGKGYGYFMLDRETSEYLLCKFADYRLSNKYKDTSVVYNDLARCSLLITLYENLLHNNLDPVFFCNTLTGYVLYEDNPLILSRALSYLSDVFVSYIYGKGSSLNADMSAKIEQTLLNMVENRERMEDRLLAFRTYYGICVSREGVNLLYSIWKDPGSFKAVKLGERELTNLSYAVLLRLPEIYNEVKTVQIQRITNPDRKAEFNYILPSLSGSKEVRDSVFQSLLLEKNRQVEPWTQMSLGFLNHYSRQESSLEYIKPGLDILEEIQRSGDIFFPTGWLKALLSGHHSERAAAIVQEFLDTHKNYPPMLKSKILQQSDHLFREKRSITFAGGQEGGHPQNKK